MVTALAALSTMSSALTPALRRHRRRRSRRSLHGSLCRRLSQMSASQLAAPASRTGASPSPPPKRASSSRRTVTRHCHGRCHCSANLMRSVTRKSRSTATTITTGGVTGTTRGTRFGSTRSAGTAPPITCACAPGSCRRLRPRRRRHPCRQLHRSVRFGSWKTGPRARRVASRPSPRPACAISSTRRQTKKASLPRAGATPPPTSSATPGGLSRAVTTTPRHAFSSGIQ